MFASRSDESRGQTGRSWFLACDLRRMMGEDGRLLWVSAGFLDFMTRVYGMDVEYVDDWSGPVSAARIVVVPRLAGVPDGAYGPSDILVVEGARGEIPVEELAARALWHGTRLTVGSL